MYCGDLEIDIANDLSRKSIIKAYQKALAVKPIAHDLKFTVDKERSRTMSQIGG